MQPNFYFSVDAPRRLIRVTMTGFFTTADVAAFRAGLDYALAGLNVGPNRHRMLVDIRDMMVQPQESVTDFQKFFTTPKYRSERIAIVVASSLSRSQVKRAAEGRGAEYFSSPEDAELWLCDDGGHASCDRQYTPSGGSKVLAYGMR